MKHLERLRPAERLLTGTLVHGQQSFSLFVFPSKRELLYDMDLKLGFALNGNVFKLLFDK